MEVNSRPRKLFPVRFQYCRHSNLCRCKFVNHQRSGFVVEKIGGCQSDGRFAASATSPGDGAAGRIAPEGSGFGRGSRELVQRGLRSKCSAFSGYFWRSWPWRRAGHSGAPDFQQMLSRLPVVAVTDLHKGDAIIILATEGTGGVGTVITLVGGVEPIYKPRPAPAALRCLLPGPGRAIRRQWRSIAFALHTTELLNRKV